MVTAKKEEKKVPWFPGCLPHAVIGVFYSVDANRHQPNLHIIYRGGVTFAPDRR